MSQRAIKRRDNSQLYQKHPVPPQRHKKFNNQKKFNKLNQNQSEDKIENIGTLKRSNSYPCLKTKISEGDLYTNNYQLRSKSLNDVTNLSTHYNFSKMNNNQFNAKSEVCLIKISEHSTNTSQNNQSSQHSLNTNQESELGGSDLTTNMRSFGSALASTTVSPVQRINNTDIDRVNNNMRTRRISQHGSLFSHTSNNSSTAISPSEYENRGFADTSGVRVPIIGYEIMEERARFTVYKLRVENPFSNDCWLVLRRYTDFQRLHNKLKQAFPYMTINLQLPRKKIFGDNFNSVFLDNRVQGLQIFVNSIMANEELRTTRFVRDFFCLDEPPSYSESMEECRAIFEAQEETIAHLKLQVNSKNDTIISLEQKLMNEIAENERLKQKIKDISSECSNCCNKLKSLQIKQ